MKVYHQNQLIGDVIDATGEQPWVSGTIELAVDLPPLYRELFAFMVDDSQVGDPPFEKGLLDPEHWRVTFADGVQRGIELPAVYEDATIMFRYR